MTIPDLTDFRYVDVDHLVGPGTPFYQHLLVGEVFKDKIYTFLKSFWYQRYNLDISDEELNDLLDNYQNTYFKPTREPLRNLLQSLNDERNPGEPLSIVELGYANGTTLHYLKTIMNLDEVRFLGVEPYKVFVDDLKNNFPGQKVIQGTAEDFPEIEFYEYVDQPVTAVDFSGILCMVTPEVAKRCLEKAATMTDLVFGFDYCLNARSEIDFNDEEVVMFEYNSQYGQLYFTHEFDAYFKEIGFTFEIVKPMIPGENDSNTGWATFRARRDS